MSKTKFLMPNQKKQWAPLCRTMVPIVLSRKKENSRMSCCVGYLGGSAEPAMTYA